MARVHIIGAGLSGLSCALELADAGAEVHLYEAAGHAGGRCRSYFDKTLKRSLDNGNHLMLAGNEATMAYLDRIDAGGSLTGPDEARFPFLDLASGRQWTIRPNASRVPWWIFAPARRAPETTWRDYAAARRLRKAQEEPVAAMFDTDSPAFTRFWEPLSLAVLNAPPEEAAAHLLWPVLVETFGRGGRACRPRIAAEGLSQSLIDPAIEALRDLGVRLHFNCRVRRLEFLERTLSQFQIGSESPIDCHRDTVIFAVPSWTLEQLWPAAPVPEGSYAIAGAHFRLDTPPALPGGETFLGLVGGTAQWLFVRGDVASITISAAGERSEAGAEKLARTSWADVARALDLDPGEMPPWRVIQEKRATFAQTPAQTGNRPGPKTDMANVYLAGDWTDTGLPATIEGSIRSGKAAARAALTAGR